MSRLESRTFWASAYGDFQLPDDFPSAWLRVDGWFDRRIGLYPKMREYILEQSDKLCSGAARSGFVAPSWLNWMVCGSIPNRLHGAAVNSEGDAI